MSGRSRVTAFVQTHTGIPFYPLAPLEDDITIVDIAHSLGMVCRYGGHVQRFYSVAEHCVLLSHAVAPENALWALLHDATEAYVGDVVWPLKEELPRYKDIEDTIMQVICIKYNLPLAQPEQVKEYDRRIVIDERDQLMSTPRQPWPALQGFAPLGVTIRGWHPAQAREQYLTRFTQLYTASKETRSA